MSVASSASDASGAPAPTSAHDRYVERAQEREEPSQTKTLRMRYAQRLRGRWDAIQAALRKGIVEFDALGLRTEALVDAPRDFAFDSADESTIVETFDSWLARQTDREILQQFGQENQFVTSAYERGVDDARTELRKLGLGAEGAVGTALQLPVHQEQLRALYTRNFNALQGMNDATANQMRRVLSEGLAGGDGPREIARDLSDRIEKVGRYRATLIGRTEVMHSHNRARATEWDRAGVQQVDILIAPDACPECVALKAGEPYSVSEAPGLLPLHPQCRCALAIHTEGS
jgi:SPP1 gp7 family putative phage head morphogenesis protein